MRGRRTTTRAGLTAVEIALAVTLLAIVLYKGVTVMNSATRTTAEDNAQVLLEDRAQLVLERIARAVMSSDRDTLNPSTASPLSTDDLQYRVHLGIEDGEVVWSDPETIGLEDLENSVYWSRQPEAGPEKRVVWTNLVRPFLEGETPNGMDDNGNGLIDEKGLSFVVDRNAITIRLTLDRMTPSGRTITSTVQTTVTCRNVAQPDESAP